MAARESVGEARSKLAKEAQRGELVRGEPGGGVAGEELERALLGGRGEGVMDAALGSGGCVWEGRTVGGK